MHKKWKKWNLFFPRWGLGLLLQIVRSCPARRVSQGFWGTREHWQNIEENKGTLANFWEQGNKIRKVTVRKHSVNVWEYGNIGKFWKGTRTPLGDPQRGWNCFVLQIKAYLDKRRQPRRANGNVLLFLTSVLALTTSRWGQRNRKFLLDFWMPFEAKSLCVWAL